jgi:hypothetical protein
MALHAGTTAEASGAAFLGGTVGSILFVGTGPVISENNSALFWDNTNAALTVGASRIFTSQTSNFFAGKSVGNFTLTGDFNTFLGTSAGSGLTSGQYNTFGGFQAGLLTTSGNSSTAFGYQAMRNAVNGGGAGASGEGNCLFGYVAGSTMTTAESISGFGYSVFPALTTAIECVGVGSGAGHTLISGNGVTLIGHQSGYLVTGAKVTSLGWQAGYNNTSGANNIYIGASADASSGTITNACVIGYSVSVGTSNTMVLGNSSTVLIRNDGDNAADLGSTTKRFKSIYFGTQTIAPDGSASTPSYSFASAGNWGMYYSATAGVAFTVAGTSNAAVDTLGYVVGGTTGYFAFTNGTITGTADTKLFRDAANTLALKNANAAQEFRVYAGNGANMATVTVNESLTIAAASTTDSATTIPAGAIIIGVGVRVTTVIPTAATFTMTAATGGNTFSTAAVSTAANTTDRGTAAGALYTSAGTKVRITPNLTPGAATGVVRLAITYLQLTAPTS